MFGSLGMTELAIIALIALVIFGPSRLPKMARGFGEAIREFRNINKTVKEGAEAVTREGADVARTIENTVREPLKEDRRVR